MHPRNGERATLLQPLPSCKGVMPRLLLVVLGLGVLMSMALLVLGLALVPQFRMKHGQLPRDTQAQLPRATSGQLQLLRGSRIPLRRPSGSCWSRQEMPRLLRHAFAHSPAFSLRLVHYQGMHRRCTALEAWADFSGSSGSGGNRSSNRPEGCLYLVHREINAGLGNRLLDLVSAFAYAMLTDRALLIAPGGYLGSLLCNPFEPSPWLVSEGQWRNITTELAREKERERLQGQLVSPEAPPAGSNLETWRGGRALGLDLTWEAPAQNSVFFCQRNQEQVVRHFQVLVFTSGQHLLPALHLVPSFHATLQAWFPQGHEFLHLGRFMVHPVNKVWLRIIRYYGLHQRHHTRLVGVQIRQFREEDETCVDERVLHCLTNTSRVLSDWLTEEDFLHPRTALLNSTVGAAAESEAVESTGILVTALNATHADVLSDFIRRHVPPQGHDAAVFRISNERAERTELNQFELALMEMVLLSFSDVLLTTYFSTFGNVASGLAGGPTYLLNIVVRLQADWRQNGRPACERASPEPCQHTFPGTTLKCGEDERNITEHTPSVSTCDALNTGLQYHRLNM